MNRLGREFFDQPTRQLARSLLGKTLVRKLPSGEPLSGVVVEVEAYLASGDVASHSHRGLGKKNRSMFENAGTLYVYPIHARCCMNIVSECQGRGAAVLIRAIEPLQGHVTMAMLRENRKDVDLTRGPGRLCQALDVQRVHDGLDLVVSNDVWLEDESEIVSETPWKTRRSNRIGLSAAKELQLRWFVDGNRFVSGLARDHTSGRTWSYR